MADLHMRSMIVQKVGIIDLDGLYKTMQKWFYDNNYLFEEPTSRIRPGTPAGIELEYRWTAWRKVNAFVKFHVIVRIYAWDVKDMEVIKNGEKVKLTKCRIKINIDGHVEVDWQKRFQKNKFTKLLYNLLMSLIYQEEKVVALWWDELYYRLYKLQTIAKEYLDMESKGNTFYDVW
jgi:hypothetical protein